MAKPIVIAKSTIYASAVGRLQEPMVIGNNASGNNASGNPVCLHIASDMAEAKKLASDYVALQNALNADHADAIARGYEDDRRFVLK